MPLVVLEDLLRHARRRGYAVIACQVTDLAVLHGVLDAVEVEEAPSILVVEGGADRVDLVAAAECAAARSRVPLAIHWHGIVDETGLTRAINAGCNSVGLAGGLDEEVLRALARTARNCGVPLAAPADTDISTLQAAGVQWPSRPSGADGASWARTGPDSGWWLHCDAEPAPGRVEEYLQSGVVAVHAAHLAALAVSSCLQDGVEDPERLQAAIRRSVALRLVEWVRRWGAAGQAADARARCRRWTPVEHVILFNVQGLDEAGAADMMAEGRRVLAAIPGVRRVFTGEAVQSGARYRYCWVIRFVHPAVIDSYRHHPQHVAFADGRFRPVAGDRVSIDYQALVD